MMPPEELNALEQRADVAHALTIEASTVKRLIAAVREADAHRVAAVDGVARAQAEAKQLRAERDSALWWLTEHGGLQPGAIPPGSTPLRWAAEVAARHVGRVAGAEARYEAEAALGRQLRRQVDGVTARLNKAEAERDRLAEQVGTTEDRIRQALQEADAAGMSVDALPVEHLTQYLMGAIERAEEVADAG